MSGFWHLMMGLCWVEQVFRAAVFLWFVVMMVYAASLAAVQVVGWFKRKVTR